MGLNRSSNMMANWFTASSGSDDGDAPPSGARVTVTSISRGMALPKDAVAKIIVRPQCPFPKADSPNGSGFGNAKRGKAVEHGDAGVELRELPVEVSSYQALTQ